VVELARPPVLGRPVFPLIGLAVLGAGIALSMGLAAGNPTPATLAPAILVAGITVMLMALARPFGAFLVLASSTMFMLDFALPEGRGLNAFDFLLPSVLIAGYFGTARDVALAEDRRATDARHLELHAATRSLTLSVMVFYGIAVLSVVVMALVGPRGSVFIAVTSLARAAQGVLMFSVGSWWLRSERRIRMTIQAMFAGAILFAIVNCIAIGFFGVKRAGMAWYFNQPEWPLDGPNEAGTAMLFMITLLLVRQTLTHRFRNLLMIAIAVAMLVLTMSRSGLLATLVFSVLVLPRARWRWVLLAGLLVAVAVPLVPTAYWTRIAKTLTLQRGTFEAYTSLVRFYSWKVAIAMFLDHPLLGVGYLGFTALSGGYGELRVVLGPAENYYLEIATSMGVPGVIALGVVIYRIFRLGAIVRRHAPDGTLAHAMAAYHAPLVLGLMVVNLTGSHMIGMTGLGQLALWLVLLVRSAHLGIDAEPRAAATA
jgi:O-antigen ligase